MPGGEAIEIQHRVRTASLLQTIRRYCVLIYAPLWPDDGVEKPTRAPHFYEWCQHFRDNPPLWNHASPMSSRS